MLPARETIAPYRSHARHSNPPPPRLSPVSLATPARALVLRQLAIIADSNSAVNTPRGGGDATPRKHLDAFAELEPRLLAERLFERLVEQQLRQHELNCRIAALKVCNGM